MCIIIHKPKDVILDEQTIRDCYKANDDGFGFAERRPDDGGWNFRKGLYSIDEAVALLMANPTLEQAIHFRKVSVGTKSTENCHPFWNEDASCALMHNGTISDFGGKKRSDTLEIHEMLCQLEPRYRRKLLETLGTSWNRFCLIQSRRVELFGEFKTHKGCKFSTLPPGAWAPVTVSTYNRETYYDSGDGYPHHRDWREEAKQEKKESLIISPYPENQDTVKPTPSLVVVPTRNEEQEQILEAVQQCWGAGV